MGRFKFSLESVLKIREFEEEKIKEELAALNLELKNSRLELRDLQLEVKSTYSSADKPYYFELAFQRYLYLATLNEKITFKNIEIQKIESEMENCQERLVEAHRNTKMLENLKDKKFQQYRKEVDLLEQKLQDDLGISGYIAKKANM